MDDDVVESNLNRQKFYAQDIGRPKAIALVQNLQRECTYATMLTGHVLRLDEVLDAGVDLACDVVVCGVDNNPTRMLASRTFRERGVPMIFLAVSREADHGYVFVQETTGPCLACIFPDIAGDERYPCPGTPAVLDILQVVGGIAMYGVDTCLMGRKRMWNYRGVNLADGKSDAAGIIARRSDCTCCGGTVARQESGPARLPNQLSDGYR
jgi:molybdopterin/thiamine biosynthesis adenylyltransferase